MDRHHGSPGLSKRKKRKHRCCVEVATELRIEGGDGGIVESKGTHSLEIRCDKRKYG